MSNALLERLKKNCKIKESAILSESKFFGVKDFTSTEIPMLNVALSGNIDGGLTAGVTTFAGPSKHLKSLYSLIIASAYLKKNKDAVLYFYDSEFGCPQSYFTSCGIDLTRVLHIPIKNLEELKFDLVSQLDNITRQDKVIIIIDSIGNLASRKELEDTLNEKSVADMTRAKQLKSIFRMVVPILEINDIPLIVVNHTYKEIALYPKDIMSGGCFEEGTLIKMADGSNKAINEIKVGELVITRDGPRAVSYTWNPDTLVEGNPECYEIEFEDGTIVNCSDTHPFSINGSWVQAQDLVAGIECDTI